MYIKFLSPAPFPDYYWIVSYPTLWQFNIAMERSTIFNGYINPLFLWPFSAIFNSKLLVYQRVNTQKLNKSSPGRPVLQVNSIPVPCYPSRPSMACTSRDLKIWGNFFALWDLSDWSTKLGFHPISPIKSWIYMFFWVDLWWFLGWIIYMIHIWYYMVIFHKK